MSDSILRYGPADPFWQPSPEGARKGAALLKSIVAKAHRAETNFEDKVYARTGPARLSLADRVRQGRSLVMVHLEFSHQRRDCSLRAFDTFAYPA